MWRVEVSMCVCTRGGLKGRGPSSEVNTPRTKPLDLGGLKGLGEGSFRVSTHPPMKVESRRVGGHHPIPEWTHCRLCSVKLVSVNINNKAAVPGAWGQDGRRVGRSFGS